MDLDCPVCMDVFLDPVTVLCGHSFCLHCLRHLLAARTLRCPLCQVSIPPNLPLNINVFMKNLVENEKKQQVNARRKERQQFLKAQMHANHHHHHHHDSHRVFLLAWDDSAMDLPVLYAKTQLLLRIDPTWIHTHNRQAELVIYREGVGVLGKLMNLQEGKCIFKGLHFVRVLEKQPFEGLIEAGRVVKIHEQLQLNIQLLLKLQTTIKIYLQPDNPFASLCQAIVNKRCDQPPWEIQIPFFKLMLYFALLRIPNKEQVFWQASVKEMERSLERLQWIQLRGQQLNKSLILQSVHKKSSSGKQILAIIVFLLIYLLFPK